MTRILVTGANGFLGSHILSALAALPDIELIAACRRPENLPASFAGEVRQGDLTDPVYRRQLLIDIDVVCNAGNFGTFWGHAEEERTQFYLPTRDLLEQAVKSGVKRFIQTSTVAIGPRSRAQDGPPADDFSLTRQRTGFWPHVDHLVDLDRDMRRLAGQGTQMITMRLGHFVGRGNTTGLLPMLVPRLQTHMVPWLAGGGMMMPLVTGPDMGRAYALAATAADLGDFESFNICGPEYPTMREFFGFVASETGLPRPHYSVSYPAAYAFGWLMEKLNRVLPGEPFLMRSIVFVSENWNASQDYAKQRLGFVATEDWRAAVREQLQQLSEERYSWLQLAPTTELIAGPATSV